MFTFGVVCVCVCGGGGGGEGEGRGEGGLDVDLIVSISSCSLIYFDILCSFEHFTNDIKRDFTFLLPFS